MGKLVRGMETGCVGGGKGGRGRLGSICGLLSLTHGGFGVEKASTKPRIDRSSLSSSAALSPRDVAISLLSFG